MNITLFDMIIRWLGGVLAYSILGILLYGIWRGTQRQAGRTTGLNGGWLRSPCFFLASALLFFGVCYFGWIPLRWTVSPQTRVWVLVIGSLLYFPGMLFALWGRLALGKKILSRLVSARSCLRGINWSQADHLRLYVIPCISGFIVAAFGALLIYSTWMTLIFACLAPLTSVRARREEVALSTEFGEQWT